MFKVIRSYIRKSLILRKFFGYYLASSGLLDWLLNNYKLSNTWKKRISITLSSPDNKKIPKVSNAGVLKRGIQTMHNGLKIYAGSYYGPEYTQLFKKTNGVHEPQEEAAFQEILNLISDGSTMIELGAFWSFYSMWFNKQIVNAKNFMIEPDPFNLGQGKRNFRLNKMKGEFFNAFIGKDYIEGKIPTVSVDYIMKLYQIQKLAILHSDIQGFELDMLEGCKESFHNNSIDFVFISTHSNDLHYKCIEQLKKYNQKIIWEFNLDASYSHDGLIVSCNKDIDFETQLMLSSRKN